MENHLCECVGGWGKGRGGGGRWEEEEEEEKKKILLENNLAENSISSLSMSFSKSKNSLDQ